MKNKEKIWRIIWLIGVYLILALILYLIVIYKIKFEDRDLSDYLYFYNCSNEICTTNEKQSEYISRIKCHNNTECPYVKEMQSELAILKYPTKELLYNYKNDTIINEEYLEYHFLNNEKLSVKNEDNKYGIITTNNDLIVTPELDGIISLNNNYLIYTENAKYGIKTINNDSVNIYPQYDDLVYISDNLYAAKIDNKYKIFNYYQNQASQNEYNYIFSENEYIFTFEGNRFDILNNSLKSILIIKIKTYYDYSVASQITSLNKRVEEGKVLFKVKTSQTKTTEYSFDTKKGVLTELQ